MAAILTAAAQAAHSAVSAATAVAQVKPGATITSQPLKESGPTDVVNPKFEGSDRKVSVFTSPFFVDMRLITF